MHQSAESVFGWAYGWEEVAGVHRICLGPPTRTGAPPRRTSSGSMIPDSTRVSPFPPSRLPRDRWWRLARG